MSIAKKCDVCGSLYESYSFKRSDSNKPNGIMLLNIDNKQQYWSHGAMDLCPECLAAVQNVIKERSETNGRNL